MNTPPIESIEVALELYYSKIALYTADIQRLFPKASSTTIWRLKKAAREEMDKNGRMPLNNYSVSPEDAYVAWGLNVESMESKLKRLRKVRAS